MDDLISRQAAIDALWKALYDYEDKTEKQFQESGGLDVGDWIEHRIFVQNMSDIDRQTILNLPPAQPEQRWTPCNERMPETTDYYLIQHSRHICQDEMAVAFYSVEEAELDKNYTWEFKPFADLKEVIAWMPLPEPYKEEGKNETD